MPRSWDLVRTGSASHLFGLRSHWPIPLEWLEADLRTATIVTRRSPSTHKEKDIFAVVGCLDHRQLEAGCFREIDILPAFGSGVERRVV